MGRQPGISRRRERRDSDLRRFRSRSAGATRERRAAAQVEAGYDRRDPQHHSPQDRADPGRGMQRRRPAGRRFNRVPRRRSRGQRHAPFFRGRQRGGRRALDAGAPRVFVGRRAHGRRRHGAGRQGRQQSDPLGMPGRRSRSARPCAALRRGHRCVAPRSPHLELRERPPREMGQPDNGLGRR